ncbi:MAG: hypothetical protein E3J72_07150 [Planctomycetota bacterium]|nr:MAG: hypothetical protein E3J72_07150 [Planctomycetota bacterium]
MSTVQIVVVVVVFVGGFIIGLIVWWLTKILARVMTFIIPLLAGAIIAYALPEEPEIGEVIIWCGAGMLASAIVAAGYMVAANLFEIEQRLKQVETIRVKVRKRRAGPQAGRPRRRPIQPQKEEVEMEVETEIEAEEAVDIEPHEDVGDTEDNV